MFCDGSSSVLVLSHFTGHAAVIMRNVYRLLGYGYILMINTISMRVRVHSCAHRSEHWDVEHTTLV
jgi:hypothetical protein